MSPKLIKVASKITPVESKVSEKENSEKKGEESPSRKVNASRLPKNDSKQPQTQEKAQEKKSQFVEKGDIFHLPRDSKTQPDSSHLNSQKLAFLNHEKKGSEQKSTKNEINWSKTLGTALSAGLFQTEGKSLSLKNIHQVLLLGWADLKGKAILVGNLTPRGGDAQVQEIRLALLKIPSSTLLSEFKHLNPGEKIPTHLLAKLADGEGTLRFEQVTEQKSSLKEALEQREAEPRMDPRFRSNIKQQNKWERSVENRRNEGKAALTFYEEEGESAQKSKQEEIFANTYELMGLRKPYDENPKIHMLLTYTAITSIIAIAMLYLWSVISSS